MRLKSPCCGEAVRRYGERRRQCLGCKKTWRVRRKRRGRKIRRNQPTSNDQQLLKRYLNHAVGSMARHAESSFYPDASTLHKRMQVARDAFLARPWHELPPGKLILIADGLQYQHQYRYRTMYLVLVRSPKATEAVILPPTVYPGKESQSGWNQALASLDPATRQRIAALVCDGHPGLVNAAKHHGWVLQRCHFHVKQSLNNYLRTGRKSTHEPLASEVHALVDLVLTSTDDRRLYEQVLPQLEWCARLAPSVGARHVLSSLQRFHGDFRQYIYCDGLNLPRTSNTAESAVNIVRSLEKRAHGWATPASFEAWAAAALKHKAVITCRESQPN